MHADLLQSIFAFLDARSVAASLRVAKEWRSCGSTSVVWKPLYYREAPYVEGCPKCLSQPQTATHNACLKHASAVDFHSLFLRAALVPAEDSKAVVAAIGRGATIFDMERFANTGAFRMLPKQNSAWAARNVSNAPLRAMMGRVTDFIHAALARPRPRARRTPKGSLPATKSKLLLKAPIVAEGGGYAIERKLSDTSSSGDEDASAGEEAEEGAGVGGGEDAAEAEAAAIGAKGSIDGKIIDGKTDAKGLGPASSEQSHRHHVYAGGAWCACPTCERTLIVRVRKEAAFDEYNFLMDVVAECVSALPARQQQLQQRFQQQMAALSAATSLLPQQQTDGKESKAAGSGGAASSSLMNSAGAAPSLPAAAAVAAAAPSYAAAAAAASGLPAVVVYTDANREASRKFAKRFWRLSRGFVRLGAQAELAAAAENGTEAGILATISRRKRSVRFGKRPTVVLCNDEKALSTAPWLAEKAAAIVFVTRV